eukprot:CAMPEP_0185850848 /NCGR_PEP_ID=MMETSP1354-20130828/4823_1 /TAXON_ID=708628 /ORGANISM="Erythrolobus madagascarensis, Strain CCMP3276" /LENGTH=369 /DNA_ID=CAMNT_0028551573 /DNA_START=146 /DNA_END=1255 /DNA_ORIENTATION=-
MNAIIVVFMVLVLILVYAKDCSCCQKQQTLPTQQVASVAGTKRETTTTNTNTGSRLAHVQKGSSSERRVYFKSVLSKKIRLHVVGPWNVPGTYRNVVVDVGANDGSAWSIEGATREQVVYAFEPSPPNQANFLHTMEVRNVQRVEKVQAPPPLSSTPLKIPTVHSDANPVVYLIQAAVGNKQGSVRFRVDPCSGKLGQSCGKVNRVLSDDEPAVRVGHFEEIEVPMVKFDDIEGIDRDRIWAFKVDVEGLELEVFRGAYSTLRDHHIPFVAFEMSGSTIDTVEARVEGAVKIFELLGGLGYDCYHMRGFNKCPDGVRANSEFCWWTWPQDKTGEGAPSFEEYARSLFESHGLSDILCVNDANVPDNHFI